MIDFRLQNQGIDPTEVLKSYGMGRDFAIDEGSRTALSGLVANPKSPAALLEYGRWAPENAFKIGQEQQAAQAKRQQVDDETLWKAAAQVAGEAKDEAHFEGAIDYYITHGFPQAAQFRGQWANRDAIMARGGYKPPVDTQSALEREYNFVEGIRPGGGRQLIDNRLDPLVPIMQYGNNGQAFQGVVPRSQLIMGQQSQQGAPPPIGTVVADPRIAGGPTPGASGGFP